MNWNENHPQNLKESGVVLGELRSKTNERWADKEETTLSINHKFRAFQDLIENEIRSAFPRYVRAKKRTHIHWDLFLLKTYKYTPIKTCLCRFLLIRSLCVCSCYTDRNRISFFQDFGLFVFLLSCYIFIVRISKKINTII